MINKNIIYYLIFILSLIIIVGCSIKNSNLDNNNNKIEEGEFMKILINNNEYTVELENNDTVKKIISILPLELDMNELNGNEKYIYMNESFPTNQVSPKHINAGDVMLYGNNCLVIFYKSFDTTYNYTKIGHINNLTDLGDKNIKVKIYK